MESLPIVIPSAPAPVRRPPTPFVAALVPVAAGVGLWAVTGSLFSLCFAALGPLMIFASLIDGARSRRRSRREGAVENAKAWTRVEEQLAGQHDEERQGRWHRHPDAAACLDQPPLRGSDPLGPRTEIVVGSGTGVSVVRASGGDGERERAFRERCGRLEDVPVTVPLGGGVALRGGRPLVESVARALALQLALRFGAAQMTICGDGLDDWGLAQLPQAKAARRGAFRLGVARAGSRRPDCDSVIWMLHRGDDVAEGITTVIDIDEPTRAFVRTPQGVVRVAVEGLSHDQAVAIAQTRVGEAEEVETLPAEIALGGLRQQKSSSGLPATIGRGERDDVALDIVEDGPHAIVTGTTGSGKSELLVSWVTAIATAHGPDRVVFVLADFKGGTAFDPLRALPQVAAVITDLDDEGARRGVTSLSAELRRRESVLAGAGVRDVRESDMPRLVIVVDEFAALLQEHPDLGAVFTDIAARGRALGMHLILGTQRASGVIRDALASNCPLRVSLRVSDSADSRAVIGTDAAAELPGGVASRGVALARRPQDDQARVMRVALTDAADIRAVAALWSQAETPQSPWLPALERRIPLSDVGDQHADRVILGRVDDPEHQRQPLDTLAVGADRGLSVVGAAGSGRTSVLRALAAQDEAALWIPRDPEEAWDMAVALSSGGVRPPRLVLCDDIDVQVDGLPADYAQHLMHLWEQILRNNTDTTFVLTSARAGGAVGRVLDILPRRGLLRMRSRVDHLAAGGDARGFESERPPGRMRIGDREIQVVWVPDSTAQVPGTGGEDAVADGVGKRGGVSVRRTTSRRRASDGWAPRLPLTGLVTTGAPAVAEALSAVFAECDVLCLSAAPGGVVLSDRPAILIGEPEAWQRDWSLWQRVRREGEVLVRAENAVELRQLAGVRDLPPFARQHAGRAWSMVADSAPRRVSIPALAARR
ncbi:ESAT-6 secretion machinery protein EssC [Microbacterium foliorum]|nr:ESAT-6 secretion machinery protein EssC [Microbacterium foliorum]CAH0129313.1 ESAT-6 secretion machinery protein EssC [Microbacterium foliorum]